MEKGMERTMKDTYSSTRLRQSLKAALTLTLLISLTTLGTSLAGTINGGVQTSATGGGPGDDAAVTIQVSNAPENNPVIRNDGTTVISHGDYATVIIDAGSYVVGNANNNASPAGGFGTGPNVIELGSNGVVTVNGTVEQRGTTTNDEAINFHGTDNVLNISADGVVKSANGAAIWFQDQPTEVGNPGANNTVVNRGTISTGKGAAYNVFGSSASSDTQPGLDFLQTMAGLKARSCSAEATTI